MSYKFLFFLLLPLHSFAQIANSPDLFVIKEHGKYGYINSEGKTVINCQFDGVKPFSEGLAAVRHGSYWGFIDTTGKMVIPATYHLIYDEGFVDNKVTLALHGPTVDEQVTLNKSGARIKYKVSYEEDDPWANIIDPDSSMMQEHFPFYDSIAKAWGFRDRNKQILIPAQFDEVAETSFMKNSCYVEKGNTKGFINMKGEFVWQDELIQMDEYLPPSKKLSNPRTDVSAINTDTLSMQKPLLGTEEDCSLDDYSYTKISPDLLMKQQADTLNYFGIYVDTINKTVFGKKHAGYNIYFFNPSANIATVPDNSYPEDYNAQTTPAKVALQEQALNKKGEWQTIALINVNDTLFKLSPKHFRIFSVPFFKGNYTTQIRFMLDVYNNPIYSNSFTGKINVTQFLKDENEDKLRNSKVPHYCNRPIKGLVRRYRGGC